jgi:hypothetical protein
MVAPGSTEEQRVEAMLKDKWPWWLELRYGTIEAMNRAYNAKFASFSEVPGSIGFIEKPFDICACYFRNYLNDRG